MGSAFIILVLVVVLALVFDYINGFHDTANAVATVVSTNVLPGRTAVMLAAACNFIGAFTRRWSREDHRRRHRRPGNDYATRCRGRAARCNSLNLLTWYFGIPSSSSHALIGGLVGSVWCHRIIHGDAADEAFWGLLTSKGVVLTLQAACSVAAVRATWWIHSDGDATLDRAKVASRNSKWPFPCSPAYLSWFHGLLARFPMTRRSRWGSSHWPWRLMPLRVARKRIWLCRCG